jgi:hypothetical protein
MACSGNPNEICGGSSALSLYRSTKSNGNGLNSDLTSKTTALPAGWTSTTCMQEVSGRAFTKKSTASDSMTIGQCVSFCGDSKYAALEYGREVCYCLSLLYTIVADLSSATAPILFPTVLPSLPLLVNVSPHVPAMLRLLVVDPTLSRSTPTVTSRDLLPEHTPTLAVFKKLTVDCSEAHPLPPTT